LPVMFLAPGQSPAFGGIAERHPGLNLIIDHMNLSVDIAKAHKVGEAIEQTVALARYPNVSCKMSSSPTYSLEPYPFADMKPHLKRVFEAFGPQRSYWGTDITHSFAKATYKQRITHFTETLDFLSEEDKDWVMGRAIEKRLGLS
jgi:predicted TIM-barrel fold metal-dependent hydrolase